MLGKLIKHEFRATRWNFCILFILMMGITLLMKPLFWIRMGILESEEISITATEILTAWIFFLMIGIFATAAGVLIAIRYYQSMTCNEAYLTFTLPVTPTQIIWSKVIVGSIWYMVTFLCFMLCIVLGLAGTPLIQSIWPLLWEDLSAEISIGSFLLWGLEIIPVTVSSMLLLICVVGIGQLFGKYRLLGTIGSYMVLNMVLSVILFGIAFSTGMITFSYAGMDAGEMELLMEQTADNLIIWEWVFVMAFSLILGCAAFLAAKYIFTKKLNLE